MTKLRVRRIAPVLAGLIMGLLASGWVAGAQAQSKTGEAFGALRAIFYHELGHGLIDVLKLPTVGPEENVVDEFATYMLIMTGRRDQRQVDALMSVAKFWQALSARQDGALQGSGGWGEHPPDIRRFFSILCLLHGSDPGRYYPLVESTGMSQNRARKCEREYAQKEQSWIRILRPHLRSAEANGPRGLQAAYGAPMDTSTSAVRSLWSQSRFLESLADEANAIFNIERPIPVIGRSCGFANAYWDGQAITLCYEMQTAVEEVLSGTPQSGEREPASTPLGSSAVSGGAGSGESGTGSTNTGSSLGQSN